MSTTQIIHLHHMDVEYLSQQSGIFVGNNESWGWSCTAKTNIGFGNVSDAIMLGCTSILMDNDIIDLLANNVQNVLDKKGEHQLDLVHTNIFMPKIDVNAVNASSVAVGVNQQHQWTSQAKQNMGNGMMTGKSIVTKTFNVVCDHDYMDTTYLDAYRTKAQLRAHFHKSSHQ